MKMKKILCGIIACLLILSLCACGNTENKDDVAIDATKATEVDNTAELQKYYESYFQSEDFGFAGNSITAKTDGATIELALAEDNSGKVSIGYGENLFEIYKTTKNEQYAHIIMPDEETGETADAWYHCVIDEKNEEDEEDVFASMSSDVSFDEYKVEADEVKSVKYLRTENGIDYINVVKDNEDYDAETVQTTYEVEFVQDEKTYSFTYTTTVSENGTGTSVTNENVPDGFEVLDYEFDFEKNVMKHEENGKTISFEVISKTEPEKTVEMEFGIDAKTHKIVSISGEENGASVMVEFSTTDTVKVDVPDTVEECDEETLAMLYLAAMFSLVQ